jgi:electron transfer flavoprotein alpha subunit
MSKIFLVVAEQRDGKLRQVSLEALNAAHLCADDGDRISMALIGHNLSSLAEKIAGYPSDQVYTADHADLENYNPETYFSALKQFIEEVKPDAVIFGHTAFGRDMAPRAAAYLQAGQISDITAVEKKGDDLLFTRPLYAGKAFEQKRFISSPWVLTVRPNNIAPIEAAGEGSKAAVTNIQYAGPTSLRTVVKDVVRKTSGKVDLAEAKIVVSGGRGVKSAEGFKPLQELADVLGGAVGASRGACDAGYCDYSLQIGQTGKVVTPEIYIACGISGAIQHLAGMSQSRIIIAINKDPEAPIFQVADYGIVGDLFEVVPLLTEVFKRILQP